MLGAAKAAMALGVLLGVALSPGTGAQPGIVAAPRAGSAVGSGEEVLEYRWHLEGFLGALAGLVFPNEGCGSLTTKPTDDGRLLSELLITSEESAKGEFWSYGAEIDPFAATTVRAWSAYQWRGRSKYDEQKVGERGVVDIASAIFRLRADPPNGPTRMQIWSDGKIYPVEVVLTARKSGKIEGENVLVRRFHVHGIHTGEARYWKGELNLTLAENPRSTPLVIEIERGWARVELDLIDTPKERAKCPQGAVIVDRRGASKNGSSH